MIFKSESSFERGYSAAGKARLDPIGGWAKMAILGIESVANMACRTLYWGYGTQNASQLVH